jgi:hypothetical protein
MLQAVAEKINWKSCKVMIVFTQLGDVSLVPRPM